MFPNAVISDEEKILFELPYEKRAFYYFLISKKPGMAEPGEMGCARPAPNFGRSINPIFTRGPDCASLIITPPPPDFQTFRRPCTGAIVGMGSSPSFGSHHGGLNNRV